MISWIPGLLKTHDADAPAHKPGQCKNADAVEFPFCAGFQVRRHGYPWGYSWRAVNVEQEEKDENSVLHFYRDILAFEKGIL